MPTPVFIRRLLLHALIICVASVVLPASASAADRYWVGSPGGNWNDTANWSVSANTCGTGGGASVPGTADIARFVSSCTNNALANVHVSVAGINIASGYTTGTISQSPGITFTVGTSGFIQVDGTFAATEDLTIVGNFTKSGGTFEEGTGTVTFTQNTTRVYDVASTETFHHVIFSPAGNSIFIITAGDTMVVTGTLTLINGRVNTGTIDARGDINQAATFDGGSAFLDFGDNAVAQTYTIAGGIGPVLRFDNAADANDAVVLNASASLFGLWITAPFGDTNTVPINYNGFDLTIGVGSSSATSTTIFNQASGIFNAPTSITFPGYFSTVFTKSGGTYNEGANTTFSGEYIAYNVATTETFDNVTMNTNSRLTITAGDTMVVTGTLTLTNGWVDTGTIDARGDINQAATFDGGSAFLDFGDNAVAQTYTIAGGIGLVLRFDNAADANDAVVLNADATLRGLWITAPFGDASTVPFTYNGFDLTVGVGSSSATSTTIFNQASGIFNAPTNITFTGYGNTVFTKSGGTYNEGANTTFSGGYIVAYDVATTETFNNVTININAFHLTITAGDTMVVTGTLTLINGRVNTGTIDARGDINQADTFDGGSAFLDFGDNAVAQTYTIAGGIGPVLRFDNAADANDAVVLNASASLFGLWITAPFGDASTVPFTYNGFDLTVGISDGGGTMGIFNQASGIFNAPTNITFTGYGNTVFTKSGGTYNEGANTTFSGGYNISYDVATTETFDNVTINLGNNFYLAITTGDTMVVTGTLTLTNGRVEVGTLDVRGDIVLAATFDGGTSPLVFSGSAVQTFTTLNVATLDGDVIIDKSGGQVNLVGNLIMDANSQDLIIREGALDLNGSNLTVTGGTNQTLIVEEGGNLQLQGGETITASTGYPLFQPGSTVTYDGTAGSYTIKDYTYAGLAITGAGATFSLPADLTLTNLAVTAGTLDATVNNYDLTLSSSLTVTAPGTLNNRSNTVTFGGAANQTISGNITYHHFTKADATDDAMDRTLTFTPGSTQIVNGTLTLTGLDDDDRVNLVSSQLGSPWNLVVNGTQNISWVDVRDSDASGGDAITHSNTVDSGGNENWGFDETAPTVTSVTSTTANGTYGPGSSINVTVTFSEAVTSTGDITALLNSGGSCTFTISNADTASCIYAVQAGHTSGELTVSNLSGVLHDQAGNPMSDFTPTTNLAANKDIILDTTAPRIASISSDTPNGRYNAGDVIDIDLTFSEAVTSTGDVTVTLDTGGTCTFTVSAASFASCNYTVQAGHTSSDLTVSSVTGTIHDLYGNAMSNFVPITNLAANKNIIIDTTAPTITNVTSNKANGTYGAGEVIDIRVSFSENVTSVGSVTVTLDTGRTCSFTISNSSLGTCNYTVQSGDSSADLDVTSITGTINDLAGNALTNFVPAIALATNKDIVIDAAAPVISSITSDTANGRYKEGAIIDIDLTFSKEVTSTGDVTVTLDTGGTCTFSVTNSLTASCNYTVAAGHTSADLTVSSVTGTIADQSSVPMTDFVPLSNLAANKAIIIDTTAPTITSVTSLKANGTYTTAAVIDIRLNFSESVTSTGPVTVTLNTTPVRTCTVTITSSTVGSCDYAVQAGDSAAELDVTNITGTIHDLAGNSLTNFVPTTSLATNKDIVIDTAAPRIALITSSTPDGRYKAGATISIDLTFTKEVTSTGDVTVTLETGVTDRTCTFTVTAATTASCTYVVQAGDTSNDLAVQSVAGVLEDSLGNPMTNFVPLSNLAANKTLIIDTTPPTIQSLSPPDEGTALSATPSLTLIFSEAVNKGAGSLLVRRSSDAAIIETIDAAGGQVSGNGTTSITVTTTAPLADLTSFYVTVDATAFTDLAGNPFAGILNATTWNFTSGDFTPPTIPSVSTTKADGTYDIGTVIPLTVTFSEAVTSIGTVTVTLNTGRTCAFSITDASTGTCNYTVQSGDDASPLLVTSITGTVRDQFNNAMTVTAPTANLESTSTIIIDAPAPASSSSSSSSSSSASPPDTPSGGGRGGGTLTQGLRYISILNNIEAAKETILARFGETRRLSERLLAQQRRETLQLSAQDGAALQREERIAERIAEHARSLARLQQERDDLARQYAERREERLQELIALKEREMLARQEAIDAQQKELAEERERNRQDREQRLAEAEKERAAVAAEPVTGPDTQAIAERRNRLVVLVGSGSVLYRDVPLDAWYSPYVSYVVEEKIAQGYRTEAGTPTGEFGVANAVTYAEILKMALEATGRMSDLPPVPANRSARATWAAPFVAQAEALQIDALGRDLDVFTPAPRGAVLSILLQAAGIPTGIKIPSSYADVSAHHRFVGAIMTATAYGLVEGHPDGTFKPDDPINRAEAAKIIALAKELLK